MAEIRGIPSIGPLQPVAGRKTPDRSRHEGRDRDQAPAAESEPSPPPDDAGPVEPPGIQGIIDDYA